MISLREVDEAITEYERMPATMALVARLASLYTVRDHLLGSAPERRLEAPEMPPERHIMSLHSNSEFAEAIKGKDMAAIWKAIDELVDTLRMVNPRLYDGLLRQLRETKNSSE